MQITNNWFKCDGLGKRHKNTFSPSAKRYFPHPPPPPDEHALYKDNFATGNGEISKVIADIAQRDGNSSNVFCFQQELYVPSLVPSPPTAKQMGGSGKVRILVPIYGASHHPLFTVLYGRRLGLMNFRGLLSRENDKNLHLNPGKQKGALQ